MTPDDLKIGDEVVVSVDVERNGEEHPQLDVFDLVTVVNPVPDSDGEVYVVGKGTEGDGEEVSIGAWVKPEYLLTQEQADAYIEEHGHPRACGHDHHDDEDDGDEEIRQFSYVPHPEFPNLPTFETLPLGYALGVMAFISGANRAIHKG